MVSRAERFQAARAKRRRVFYDPHVQPASNLWGRNLGEDVFVIGTGTSLAGFDFARLAGRCTIALNDAVRAEGLDPAYHLFHDHGIWQRYLRLQLHPRTWVVCGPHSRKSLIKHEACTFKGRILWHSHNGAPTVDARDNDLYVDRTVATAGIQMAWKLGARRVFLLGVDGYKVREDGRERYYWDGTAKRPEDRKERKVGGLIVQDRHDLWIENMRRLARFFQDSRLFSGPWPGPGVYNLSPRSTIDAWEKVAPEVALA